jgi:hypothetical protein
MQWLSRLSIELACVSMNVLESISFLEADNVLEKVGHSSYQWNF